MDGSLTRDGYEGYELTNKIREEHPTVHILSISGDKSMGDEFNIPTVKERGTDADSLRSNIEAI